MYIHVYTHYMDITQTIQKWGNSSGVRIPKKVLDSAKFHTGQQVRFEVKNNKIIVIPTHHKPSLDLMLEKINKDNIHQETSWTEPVGNEQW